ncbi:FAD-binding domain-containing protein [Aspergillus californicus]
MILSTLLLLAGAQSAVAKCKCSPTDACWPSPATWNTLNSTVNGKLIANEPLAKPCYQGPGYSAEECQSVAESWDDNVWLAESPIGYSYPLVDTCPPINATIPGYPTCELGNSPLYSIAATTASDVAAGVKFARENNVRLVIKNTGHDISQRSQGYGSLSIWIKTIQDGLHFHDRFVSNSSCRSGWNGSAITIGGGYVWKDVYEFAGKHNHVVVGGADPTVGCIGGYLQAAGHGSLSPQFGLATDQVLEYTVVLASGETVIANDCQNTDLFTALRGGGGGTYGVVLSATVKAFPTRRTISHTLTVTDLKKQNTSAVVNATALIASRYPAIVDEGFAGTAFLEGADGMWVYSAPFIKFLDDDSPAAIKHAQEIMNDNIVNDLLAKNGTDYLVESTWKIHSSWLAWYDSTHHTTAGNNQPMMASRFFDKGSLLHKQGSLTELFTTLLTETSDAVTRGSVILLNLVAGGKVLEDAPHTAVNPAWRKTYTVLQVIDFWPANAGATEIAALKEDLTTRKLAAMKEAAPGMGTYANEADPYDPEWRDDWFGENYDWLVGVKRRYDPEGVFWCWRCVGNEGWEEVTGGALFGPLCEVE